MNSEIDIFTPGGEEEIALPLSENRVAAGFPSPAEDFGGMSLDLNRELIKNPASTFYARVSGLSMVDEGINDGDLLVIDKSIEPYHHCLAVCYIDGEFTLKRIHFEKHEGQVTAIWLQPENEQFTPIKVTQDNQFIIWGIVVHSVRSF